MSIKSKLITVVLLLAFVLTACGGAANTPANDNMANDNMANDNMADDNNANDNMEEPTEEPMEEPTEEPMEEEVMGTTMSALDGVEIEFWHVWDGGVGEALQAIVDDFNANNEYGITVVALDQGGYGDVFTNMNAAINTGELPDVVIGYNNQYLAWDSAGDVIADLQPYVDDATVGMSEDDLADFYQVFWDQDFVNGERLGLPAQRSAQYMYYNVTWAQELGFDSPPVTPEEFKAQACASTEANGDGTGGWFINTGASTMAGWIFGFGGELEAAEGGYDFNTAEAQAAFEFIHDLYASGCAWQPENFYPNPEFATRQGLYYTSSIAGLPFQLGAFEEAGNTDEWTVIPFPSVTGTPVIDIYGPSIAMVDSTPEEMLASWLFMKYFVETESQVTWIKSSGYFPTRASAEALLDDYAASNPQWADSRELVEYGKFEPRYESWSSVRGALQDAAAQLFQEDFDPADIPALLEELQSQADELHAETQ